MVAKSWSKGGESSAEEKRYAELAESAYSTDGGFPEGVSYNPKDGFSASFTPGQNGAPAVVAFRGTEMQWNDWGNNVRQGLGMGSSQYAQAIDLSQQVYAKTGGNVVFVGHSLGGGLASAAAVATGGRAITFNSAGYVSFRGSGKIRSHFVRGDILSTLQDLTPLPSAMGSRIPHAGGFHGMLSRHFMTRFTR